MSRYAMTSSRKTWTTDSRCKSDVQQSLSVVWLKGQGFYYFICVNMDKCLISVCKMKCALISVGHVVKTAQCHLHNGEAAAWSNPRRRG